MTLVLDMNLSPDLAPALAAHGRVVVTHDLDFSVILATTEAQGPSVVQIREHDLLSDDLVPAIATAVRVATGALEAGAIVTLHAERSRIRILPLGRR